MIATLLTLTAKFYPFVLIFPFACLVVQTGLKSQASFLSKFRDSRWLKFAQSFVTGLAGLAGLAHVGLVQIGLKREKLAMLQSQNSPKSKIEQDVKTLSTIMEIMHNLKLVTIAKESFTVFASQGI